MPQAKPVYVTQPELPPLEEFLPYLQKIWDAKVLTNGANGTETLSLLAARTFQENRLYGEGATLSILTFLIVMIISFTYIRFVGGNLKAMAED